MQDTKTKILIIGGTGTISTPITALLSEDPNVELAVLNRGHRPLPEGVKQIIGDFKDQEKIGDLLKDLSFDVVINFLIYRPEEAVNQIALFKDKIRQYIFISTVAVYDLGASIVISEDSKRQSNISYGQNKALCEDVFFKAYQDHGFPVTIVRPTQTYGLDRIPLSVKGKTCYSVVERILNDKPVIIHGDGKSIWHATHNLDFAYNFLKLIDNPKAIGEAFHNLNPEPLSWDIIYQELYALLNKEPKIVHIASDALARSQKYNHKEMLLGDKQYSNLFDTSKIESVVTDFKNTISISDGLKLYLKYLDKHPECRVKDEEFDKWCDDLILNYEKFIASLDF